VALLVTGVLGDEVEVFTTDDQGACACQHDCSNRILPACAAEVQTYGASWWT
jgi:hypothetical protein